MLLVGAWDNPHPAILIELIDTRSAFVFELIGIVDTSPAVSSILVLVFTKRISPKRELEKKPGYGTVKSTA